MNTGTATMNDEPMPDPTTDERPSPAPPPRQSWWHVPIARDRSDKKVGGVIAGVANAYGFDVRTTRFAVAVAALALPGVLALYISAMIFLPKRPEDAASLRDIVTERRRRPLLVVLVLLALFSGFGSWAFFGGFGWGVTLVGVGVVLWLSPNFGSSFRAASTEPGAPTSVVGHPLPAPSPHTAGHLGISPAGPTRRRHPIQAISLALGFATALVVSLGNDADWWNVSVYAVVMTVLAILVGGTVIGAIVNRSWFGIPMLIVFCVCGTALMVTQPNLDGGFGDRQLRPTTVVDAERSNQMGAGRLRIDLTDLPVTSEARTVTVQAEIGYGQIAIIVPADAELRIDSHVGAGHVVLDGKEITAGVRHDDARISAPTAPGPEPTRRTIVLDLDVGGGEINITRQP